MQDERVRAKQEEMRRGNIARRKLLDRVAQQSPWDRPMQDEGDLHAAPFDEISPREKFLTLIGLTLGAWAILGVIAAGVYRLFSHG